MEKPLLIVGASARSAAFSAARAGFEPLGFDMFADADLAARHQVEQVTPYPAGLTAAVKNHPGTPLMYLGALENHPRLVDRLAADRPFYGNSGVVLRKVRDPFLLASTLQNNGLLFPEVHRQARSLPRNGQWLCKPFRSCGGGGIAPFKDPNQVTPSLSGTYFQRRIEGLPCAAIFVAAQGSATLWGVTRQLIGCDWTGASGFQYSGSIGPSPLSDSQRQQLRRLGQVLANEFGLTGLFGVDVILEGENIWCIEVNPRYTASVEVLERELDITAVDTHVRAFQDHSLPKEPTAEHAETVGKVILYARHDIGRKDALWNTLLNENRYRTWPDITDIPQAISLIPAGAPILTLWATGANAAEVENNLQIRARDVIRSLRD